jgi:cold shock CspA family protein
MNLPLQISFHNMEPADWIERLVREHSASLERFCNHIISCRVVIDRPHVHHRNGNFYEVRIDLKVPGEEIVARREPPVHEEYKDIRVAIRDAFNRAARQLEDYVRRQRRDVKHRERLPHARVSFLAKEEGYGFLKTLDGREIYFHRNSVLPPGFERLELQTEVAFDEEEGEKGPQARSVHIVGKHNHL